MLNALSFVTNARCCIRHVVDDSFLPEAVCMSITEIANENAFGISDYDSAISYLFSLINYEFRPEQARSLADFPLGRMRSLLERLGNPQTSIPCIHIAGTKGKGSTAVMVARILEASGLRVGLFTSPHPQRYEERFMVNQQTAEEKDVVAIVRRLKAIADEMAQTPVGRPTFFEITTAAGWLHFQKQSVDLAVIEVGLGGRLDSTNLCAPLVTVISSISRDHMRLLGNTLEAIAGEKAGIIKPNIPVISGVTAAGPAAVIRTVAQTQQAPILEIDRDFEVDSSSAPKDPLSPWTFDYRKGDFQLSGLELNMLGEHQTRNAALAVTAIRQLDQERFGIEPAHIRDGLRSAKLPLRIQVLRREPTVIIDAAHNPASIQALCATLSAVQADRRVCVFSSSKDKEVAELLRILAAEFDHFILTAYQSNPRAVPVDELIDIANGVISKTRETALDPLAAMRRAYQIASQNDLICATGSFFFAAEVEQICDSHGLL